LQKPRGFILSQANSEGFSYVSAWIRSGDDSRAIACATGTDGNRERYRSRFATTPTLDVKIQESDDNTTFTDIVGATFVQVTASNNLQAIVFLRSKRYCRAVATIAGTTPSFTCSSWIMEQKKRLVP
jgi:hypothetical protein